MIRTALAVLFCIAAMPPGALIAFPWTFITRNANFLYNLGMAIARCSVWLAGVKVEICGLEKLDSRSTYIFMSNHVSNLDPPVIIPRIPGRTSVLVKKELFRIPILGPAMRLGSLVPVDRSNREAAIASVQAGVEVLKTGIHMTVFPEGTRSPDGKLHAFKKGPFYLASDSGLSVVPITITGTEKLMPKGASIIRPGKAVVTFHAPIDPQRFDTKEALMDAVRESIASALPRELRD
ncbi:MAG TPA: lysophospholipid acyltransferase family protein [Terriglobales bacterium]